VKLLFAIGANGWPEILREEFGFRWLLAFLIIVMLAACILAAISGAREGRDE
jgi:hypothetical protein